MKINCSKLNGIEMYKALTHVMLKSPHADEIAKTLDGLKGGERIVEVRAVFNGIEVDGDVLEDWLQYQYKENNRRIAEQYSDLDAEVNRRVADHLRKLNGGIKDDLYQRLSVIRDKLNNLENEIDCI